VGEKLLAISVQTFPTDYLEVSGRVDGQRSTRGSVIPLAIAAAARLEPR
jgi:hypothetical protein